MNMTPWPMKHSSSIVTPSQTKVELKDFHIDPADKKNLGLARLWKLHEIAEPESVKGRGGGQLVDLIALVRHAIHPKEPVVTVRASLAPSAVLSVASVTVEPLSVVEMAREDTCKTLSRRLVVISAVTEEPTKNSFVSPTNPTVTA